MSLQAIGSIFVLFLFMPRLLLVSSYYSRINLLVKSNKLYMSTPSSFRGGYFDLPLFAVVGASTNRDKFGNKVLRCYQQHGKNVIPISKREAIIESLPCTQSLTALSSSQVDLDMSKVGVSIITPPGATALILKEGVAVGCRHFYLQPGTVDQIVQELISSDEFVNAGVKVIQGCVLVDLGFSDM